MWYVWESLKSHIFQNAPGDPEEPAGLASTDPENEKDGAEHTQPAWSSKEKTLLVTGSRCGGGSEKLGEAQSALR